jgi:1,4-alpha-glucan branching enzyme
VFAFLRLSANAAPIIVVCNMTPVPRTGYRIGLPDVAGTGLWEEVVNTDAAIYGGSNLGNSGLVAADGPSIALTLPPLSTLIFRKKS